MFLFGGLVGINPVAEVFDREGVIRLRVECGFDYLLDAPWISTHNCFHTSVCRCLETVIPAFLRAFRGGVAMPAVSAANYSTFNRAAGFLPAVPWAAWACGTRITFEAPALRTLHS